MKIDINEDFEEEFKSTWIKGFNFWEAGCIALAFAVGIISGGTLWYLTKIPLNICIYVSIPVMLPIAAIGFFKYQGLKVNDLAKEIQYYLKTRKLAYEAEEMNHENERIFTMKNITLIRKEVKTDGRIQRK